MGGYPHIAFSNSQVEIRGQTRPDPWRTQIICGEKRDRVSMGRQDKYTAYFQPLLGKELKQKYLSVV